MTRNKLAPPMRVGLVHWTFLPTTGGVESHLFDLAHFMAQLGCEVTIITGEPSPLESDEWRTFSTPLLSIERLRDREIEISSYGREVRSFLRSIIRKQGLDVIHGHNLHHFHSGLAFALTELRDEFRFRIHHTFHETWPDVLHDVPVYRSWDGNYAVSKFVQSQCIARLGFSPRLFRLGIDTDRFKPGPPAFMPGRIPVIVHPARLLPWKGVHLSIEMLRLILDRGVDARLIVTDTQRIADWNRELTEYRRRIISLVSDLRLEELIEFRSASYLEMPATYCDADMVIYPTLGEEPYGLVPLEAMSCERPVIGSRSGGIPETVAEGKTGFIVEPGDVASLATHVIRLLLNPGLARNFGREGRRRVKRLFSGSRYAEKLLAFYKTTASD